MRGLVPSDVITAARCIVGALADPGAGGWGSRGRELGGSRGCTGPRTLLGPCTEDPGAGVTK